jgi:hypothetical protein
MQLCWKSTPSKDSGGANSLLVTANSWVGDAEHTFVDCEQSVQKFKFVDKVSSQISESTKEMTTSRLIGNDQSLVKPLFRPICSCTLRSSQQRQSL